MRYRLPVLAALVLALVACGNDPSELPDAPVVAIDAPDATPPDAPAGPASPFLAGRWRQIPSQVGEPDPVEDRAVIEIGSDASYVLTEPGPKGPSTESGTYTADDRTITITSTNSQSETTVFGMNYYATADRLMTTAMFPVGAVNGTLGTWYGEIRVNGQLRTQTVEFRADMTATLTSIGANAGIYNGTWVYEVDDIVFTFMPSTSTTIHLHIQEIRGIVLGAMWERLPAAAPAARPSRAPRANHVDWRQLAR